jgi:cytochrome P450
LQGNETTASSISNTILLLAMHPQCQDKVLAELHEVLADQTSDVTNAEINQLVYTRQVINESMRLFFVVPLVSRKVTEDFTLSNGGLVPKGCTVFIPIMSVHYRKDLWGEDVHKFNPDRFEANQKRHPYQFVPFSGGSRICIGTKYAYMSMLVLLAHLIRNYKFTTDLTMDKIEWGWTGTMRLLNGHMVRIEKRVW